MRRHISDCWWVGVSATPSYKGAVTIIIIIIIIIIAQYAFGYAGGHRFESPPDQIFFFSTQRLNCLRSPENFATHNWNVKPIQFRLVWKPKNEYSHTSIASKHKVVTAPSEVSDAESS